MPAKRSPARRPTMKDIAQRAGVSESAVSFALNDRPGVSEITRDRVRRVAEQLGWRPSTAARALSGEGAATVGLRAGAARGHASASTPSSSSSISGIQEVLAERHLGLLFQVVEDVDAECAVYRRWWAEHRVDGVLVVDPRDGRPTPGPARRTRAARRGHRRRCPAATRAPRALHRLGRRRGRDGRDRGRAVRARPPPDRAHRGPAFRLAHTERRIRYAARRGRAARAGRGPLGDHGLLGRGGRGRHPHACWRAARRRPRWSTTTT